MLACVAVSSNNNSSSYIDLTEDQLKSVIHESILLAQENERKNLVVQIEKLLPNVKAAKDSGRAIVIVIGAKPWEREHFNFYSMRDPFVIYIDSFDMEDASKFDIESLNRNGLIVANAAKYEGEMPNCILQNTLNHYLANSVDLITVDWSVTKFFRWHKEHIKGFVNLLKFNGRMVFDNKEMLFPSFVEKNGSYMDNLIDMLSVSKEYLKKIPVFFRVRFQNQFEGRGGERMNDDETLEMTNVYFEDYLRRWSEENLPNSIIVKFKVGVNPYLVVDVVGAEENRKKELIPNPHSRFIEIIRVKL